MKLQYECIPCLTKQLIKLATRVTSDEEKQVMIIEEGLRIISDHPFNSSAPMMTAQIYKYAKEVSGDQDPYKAEKKAFNVIANKYIETLGLKDRIKKSDDPFDTALRLSIAGNIIDFSLGHQITEDDVLKSVNLSLTTDLFGTSPASLKEAIDKASSILFIGDNAGEIVFDKLLIEQMPLDKITYVVKGGNIVNDATHEDAIEVGLDQLVKVIDTGAAIQGTILSSCSDEFLNAYKNADLIISKGQANYETLCDDAHSNTYFLLRAKCKSVAELLNCKTNDFVLKKYD